MIIFTKKSKIIIGAALFTAVTAAGYIFEQVEKDMFVEEIVAVEDAVSYVEVNDVNDDGLININTSDTELLAQLDGIGDALAERIVDYREENGSFETVEEITKVPGISEKKLDAIKDDIYAE